MPSILDRLFGKKEEEKKVAETPQKVSEEAARARREQLERDRQAAEAARLRAEESEKQRLAALEAEQMAKEEQDRVAAMLRAGRPVGGEISVCSNSFPWPGERSNRFGPAAQERTYVVEPGDSLSKIAKELLGDAKRWPEIYEANKALIGDNPNLIHPGQKLVIP
jgi:nucleoid-associated protein YgaU